MWALMDLLYENAPKEVHKYIKRMLLGITLRGVQTGCDASEKQDYI